NRRAAEVHDHVRGERGQFRGILANAVGTAARHAIVNRQVLAHCPAQRTQALLQHPVACLCLRVARVKRIDYADAAHAARLLRARRERPRGYRAAKHRYELAPLHSITSSARASSVGGTSRPSAFAVLRLITSSYLVGACTGKSAGFSPLRMRST